MLSEEPVDVLVVGGGITGIGVALDAATRGLTVGLVERSDFASGTSSRSSKLIHGGLRYLEQRDFRLVREALRERRLLLTRLAPHLVQPVPFLLPLETLRQRAYFGSGVALYDAMSGVTRGLPRHRHLNRTETLQAAPGVRSEALVGAIRYFDAQMDDARYALMALRTAVAYGARAVSRTSAVSFVGRNRIEGVVLRDEETGATFEARARATVLAAGVWTGELEALAGVASPVSIRASKGVHILVPREKLELSDALILRTERSVLLVVPWNGHWLIGTTDTPVTSPCDNPTATEDDVVYLLDRLNGTLRDPVTPADVTGVFAGLRPLVDTRQRDTAAVSREHVVRRPAAGLVTVAGGKYTTYRVMAADAVDAAARDLPKPVSRSRTATIALVGSIGLQEARRRLRDLGLPIAVRERLMSRYGSLAPDVANLMTDGGRDPLEDSRYLSAEIRYAVTHEGALHIEDVLARRTRIALESPDGGSAMAPVVAAIMASELQWSDARTSTEIGAYRAWASAERSAALGGDGRDW